LAAGAILVASPGLANASQGDVTIKIDSTAVIEDIGIPQVTQIAIQFSLKCKASNTAISFMDAFVQQSPNSGFGFLQLQCTGSTEKYTIHAQSNFGTNFQPGPATVSITNFSVGQSRQIMIVAP
jgi:hypothetical protein